ncbi:MAG: hypothetical protein NC133_04370 [Prevotella sp.]|nr:hypothetical protein [Prevotella sp.]
MEILLEILFGLYLEIGEILIPEHKFKPWQEVLLRLAGIFVSLAILGLIIGGVCLLEDTTTRTTGVILLAVGGGLLAAQIALMVVVVTHQIKAAKRKQTEQETN